MLGCGLPLSEQPAQAPHPHHIRTKRCSCNNWDDKECIYFCHLDIIWVNTPRWGCRILQWATFVSIINPYPNPRGRTQVLLFNLIQDAFIKWYHFSFTVKSFLTAWVVPCLAVAGQQTVVNASVQPIKPATVSAIKGENSFLSSFSSSFYLHLKQSWHFPSRTLICLLDCIKVAYVSPFSLYQIFVMSLKICRWGGWVTEKW